MVDTQIPDQSDNDADSITLDVSGNFSDPDGDTLTYSASGLPAGLSIDANTGIISGTLDHSASQSGPYSVTITANDGHGGTVTDTFNWAVANPAPTAANDSTSTAEDTQVSGNVLSNDSDPDGDPLSVTQFVVGGTTYNAGETANLTEGALTINSDGSYTFNPAANYNGTVPTATYTVSDGEGGTATANLVITVTPQNDAPVAQNSDVTGTEDTTYTFSVADFHYDDVEGDALQSVRITSIPADGKLYLNGSEITSSGAEVTRAEIEAGNLTFVPDSNESGSNEYIGDTRPDGSTVGSNDLGDQGADYAKFDFQVYDGADWSANSATMTIDINAVADTPILNLSATSITTSVTIDKDNLDGSNQGFTITPYNPDGSVGTFATHSGPDGFGVAGAASGANSETGYVSSNNTYEQVVVTFDNPVDSVDLSLAWNAPNEDVAVAFYRNGNLIETVYTGGGSDQEDPAVNFRPSDGSTFDEIRFYPPNPGDDFLIHSITFNNTEVRSDGTIVVEEQSSSEIDLQAALTDTDGSESLKVEVQDIPDGFTLTDGTHSFTSDGATTSVDISDWDRANLVLKTPDVDQDTTYTLHVVATATEYSNGDAASTSQDLNVTVLAVDTAAAPTISAAQESHVSEEGLLVANGAPYDGNPDNDPNATDDTTDSVTHNGQFIVHDVNGDPLTVSLSLPSGNYSSDGDTIDWSLSNNGHTLTGTTHNGGQEILTVSIDDDGNYTTTLKGPIDHPDISTEDTVTIPVAVTVSDGDSHTPDASSTLNIVVEDDSPVAQPHTDYITIDTATTNLVFIVDGSGSMSESDIGYVKESMDYLIRQYGDIGNVNVNIVEFRNGSVTNSYWISATDALNYNLARGGDTPIVKGLQSVVDDTYNGNEPTADQNVVYYFGDGDENDDQNAFDSYTGVISRDNNDTDSDGRGRVTAFDSDNPWTNFVTSGKIDKIYTYSVKTQNPLYDLQHLANNNEDIVSDPAIAVDNISQLQTYVADTVGLFEHGNLFDDVNGTAYIEYGADGGHIDSVEIDGTTVQYDPNNVKQLIPADHGIFTINFETGEYSYQAKSLYDHSETVHINVKDNDGDVVNSIMVTVNVDTTTIHGHNDTIITNANKTDTIAIEAESLLRNDSGDNLTVHSSHDPIGGNVTGTDPVLFTGSNSTYTTITEDNNDSDTNPLNNDMNHAVDLTDRSLFGEVSGVEASDVKDPTWSSLKFSGTIGDDGNNNDGHDSDWIKLDLKEGETLVLDIDHGTSGSEYTDTWLNLYDANGNRVAYDDDSDTSNGGNGSDATQDSYLEYNVPSDGVYYVEVSTYEAEDNNQDDAGDYDLWISIGPNGQRFTYDLSDGTDSDSATASVDYQSGDTVQGGDGDEILIGRDGTADTLNGGAGNDVIQYAETADIVNGEEGDDVLLITNDMTIDFSTLGSNQIQNIEQIDLGSANVTVDNLTLQDVLDMTDSSNDLVIKGDNGDSVVLVGGDWQQGATNDGYVEYTNNTDPTVLLKVDEDIHVTAS